MSRTLVPAQQTSLLDLFAAQERERQRKERELEQALVISSQLDNGVFASILIPCRSHDHDGEDWVWLRVEGQQRALDEITCGGIIGPHAAGKLTGILEQGEDTAIWVKVDHPRYPYRYPSIYCFAIHCCKSNVAQLRAVLDERANADIALALLHPASIERFNGLTRYVNTSCRSGAAELATAVPTLERSYPGLIQPRGQEAGSTSKRSADRWMQ